MAANHVEAYPLAWPSGWQETPHAKRRSAPFRTTLGAARDGVLEEIRLMGGTQPIISTNIPTYRRRGVDVPYADQSQAKNAPGVAVYFTLKGKPKVFPSDKWTTVADNLQAIRLSIGALRGLERWGGIEMVEQAFQGFAALPESAAPPKAWRDVLGVSPAATMAEIERSYKIRAKIYHPDVGGTEEQMADLNRAIAEARAEKGRS